MELLHSKIPANLPRLVLSHMNRICMNDNTVHGIGYGFLLGDIFEYIQVPVEEWQEQTVKDVLGEVDHDIIYTNSRGANAPLQELRASLTEKKKKIVSLQASHSAEINRMHTDYGIQHASLVEETSRLKEKLSQTQAALDAERSSNSDHLKHIFYLVSKGSPSSSLTMRPSV